MAKITNTQVFNFEGAFRGMRNPMNSWDKCDSGFGCYNRIEGKTFCYDCEFNPIWCENGQTYILGDADLKLAQSLIKAGTDHSKFMRQIVVSVDITAPLYWWKEFDTYKVGTVANSTSTMHKLTHTKITSDCFEFDSNYDLKVDGYHDNCTYSIGETIIPELMNTLESLRIKYIETKDKRYWRTLIQLLPSAWLQTRTVTMSYQNIRAMYFARQNHKLTEWSVDFIKWVKELPYANELIIENGFNDIEVVV